MSRPLRIRPVTFAENSDGESVSVGASPRAKDSLAMLGLVTLILFAGLTLHSSSGKQSAAMAFVWLFCAGILLLKFQRYREVARIQFSATKMQVERESFGQRRQETYWLSDIRDVRFEKRRFQGKGGIDYESTFVQVDYQQRTIPIVVDVGASDGERIVGMIRAASAQQATAPSSVEVTSS